MDPRYHHVSYALFRADGEDTMILAARCPDAERFAAGRQFTDALKLDDEAMSFLLSARSNGMLVIHTEIGIGVLDKRYIRHCGVGVYWHVHGDAEGLGRLIHHDVLGGGETVEYAVSGSVMALKSLVRAQDLPLYGVLTDAWDWITTRPSAWAGEDEEGCVYGEELARMIEKMAEFVGVRLIRDDIEQDIESSDDLLPVGRVRCRRPLWLEICLLYLLAEGKSLSANGKMYYRLGVLGDVEGEGLALHFRYAVEDPDRFANVLDPIHRYLNRVGELHGMEFQSVVSRLKRGERGRGILPEMRFYLDWLKDPTVLASSDLKADPEFERENDR